MGIDGLTRVSSVAKSGIGLPWGDVVSGSPTITIVCKSRTNVLCNRSRHGQIAFARVPQADNPGAVAALQETTRAAVQLQQERATVSTRRAKARGDTKPSRMWHVPALAPDLPACSADHGSPRTLELFLCELGRLLLIWLYRD